MKRISRLFALLMAGILCCLFLTSVQAQGHYATAVAHSSNASHSMDLWATMDDSGVVGPYHYPGMIYTELDNGSDFYGYALYVVLGADYAQALYFDYDTSNAAWLTLSHLGPAVYSLPGSNVGITRYPFTTHLTVLDRYTYALRWDSGDCPNQTPNRLFNQLFCWLQ